MKRFTALIISVIFLVTGLAFDAAAQKKKKRKISANSSSRRVKQITGGALGAGVGGRTKRVNSAIGAGGAGVYLYSRNGRDYYRNRNGKIYYKTRKP